MHILGSQSADIRILPEAKKESFDVEVLGNSFKFNCAHFVSFGNFREKLHGHSYTSGVRIWGSLGSNGYVMDFGIVKAALRNVCSELNEHMLIPKSSDTIRVDCNEKSCHVECADGSQFVFPNADCLVLPISCCTAEELSRYIWHCLLRELGGESSLRARGVTSLEVSVFETPIQCARYYREL